WCIASLAPKTAPTSSSIRTHSVVTSLESPKPSTLSCLRREGPRTTFICSSPCRPPCRWRRPCVTSKATRRACWAKWGNVSPGRKGMERSASAIHRDRRWPITLRTRRRITRSGVSSRSLWRCYARRVWNTIRDTCLDDSCAVPTGLDPPIDAYPALKGGAKIFRACGAGSLVFPSVARTTAWRSADGAGRLLHTSALKNLLAKIAARKVTLLKWYDAGDLFLDTHFLCAM